jgi:hypothetical protein
MEEEILKIMNECYESLTPKLSSEYSVSTKNGIAILKLELSNVKNVENELGLKITAVFFKWLITAGGMVSVCLADIITLPLP